MTLLLRSAVVFIASLAGIATAQAQTTWHVDDDNCPGPGSGTEVDPFCKIQDGIDAAVDGDTVLIADGTYTGIGNKNISYDGKAITAQSVNGPENCIIDCEGSGRGVLFIDGETKASVLSGLTIENGNVAVRGGGILCRLSSPTIENCRIRQCRVAIGPSGVGGGISCTAGSPIIVGCTLSQNEAPLGGGISFTASSPVLANCLILGNVGNVNGGGIEIRGSGSVVITDTLIVSNDAEGRGGGISIDNLSSVVITRCGIHDNIASVGGGIRVQNSDLAVDRCEFGGNGAIIGGGLYVLIDSAKSPDVAVSNSIFFANEADEGAGLLLAATNGEATISDCVFRENFAWGVGGGIKIGSAVGFVTITNTTIWQNLALGAGGGILNESLNTAITNGIIWANKSPGHDPQIWDIAGVESIRFNDIEGGWEGEGNIDADPLFVDPDSGDLHLTVDSPCIDAGDPDFEPEPDETDIDGEDRVAGVRVDMGADEFHDSDGDGVPDIADICPDGDDNLDSDLDGVPDACDVCDGGDDGTDEDDDGTPDFCDICPGFDDSQDDDGDGVPNGCDVCAGDDATGDSDGDGICDDVDICEGDDASGDVDADGVCGDIDNCELFNPDQADCQPNGVGDVCDIDSGDSSDNNKNGVPDECDPCVADLNGDDVVDASDLAVLLGSWGLCPGCAADLFVDGIVDAADLAILLGSWGPCE